VRWSCADARRQHAPPTVSCVQPEVSFLTVFNGVTISTCIFVIFCALTYFLGQRTAVAREDAQRRRRFKSRVLNVLIWCAARIRAATCASSSDATAPRPSSAHPGACSSCTPRRAAPVQRAPAHAPRLWPQLTHSCSQVSSTTLLVFGCTTLEDGTSWMMADYRQQCWCVLNAR
jgi:hypothetical protein